MDFCYLCVKLMIFYVLFVKYNKTNYCISIIRYSPVTVSLPNGFGQIPDPEYEASLLLYFFLFNSILLLI